MFRRRRVLAFHAVGCRICAAVNRDAVAGEASPDNFETL
jgi:hypothetical protein